MAMEGGTTTIKSSCWRSKVQAPCPTFLNFTPKLLHSHPSPDKMMHFTSELVESTQKVMYSTLKLMHSLLKVLHSTLKLMHSTLWLMNSILIRVNSTQTLMHSRLKPLHSLFKARTPSLSKLLRLNEDPLTFGSGAHCALQPTLVAGAPTIETFPPEIKYFSNRASQLHPEKCTIAACCP